MGFKSTLLDNTLQLNGAIYHYDYDDRQSLLVADDLTAALGTVPEAEMDGVELDLWWRPMQGLDIKAGVSYINSKVTKGPSDLHGAALFTPVNAGEELPQAPEWAYNALVRYGFDLSESLALTTQLDHSWITAGSQPGIRTGRSPGGLRPGEIPRGTRCYRLHRRRLGSGPLR